MGDKEEKNTIVVGTPGSAPELTEEDKRRIEAEMTVVNGVTENASSSDKAAEKNNGGDDVAGSVEVFGRGISTMPSKVSAVTSDNPASSEDSADQDQAVATATEKPRHGRIRRFFEGYWRRKKWTLPVTLLLLLGILAAVPYTRYPIAGLVLKRQASIALVDETTKKPVSSALVAVDGREYKTDKNGKASLGALKPGKHRMTVKKKYYQDTSLELFVPIIKETTQQVAIRATGRQVAVMVVNKITKAPLEDVTLKTSGTEVKTDKDGKAVVALPVDRESLPVTIVAAGYNELESRVRVTDAVVAENTFAIVPSGKMYFLSRQSGKIDVVKTDLDGANRQVVVYGTGKEDDKSTTMLASRDWKYLALFSRRDSGLPKLYLIDTATDKMTTIDEGDITFTLSGWSGHNFMYAIQRNSLQFFEANRQAVKKYDADKRQLVTIDQTSSEKMDAATTHYQEYGNFSLVGDKLIYLTQWFQAKNSQYSGMATQADRFTTVRSVSVGDSSKKDIKSFPSADYYSSFITRMYEPGSLYMAAYSVSSNKQEYYTYKNGKVEQISTLSDEDFTSATYPTYLTSPDGNKTFWSEQRDGREMFFVGDAKGQNGKQISVWNDYAVYGWFTDAYVLVSKGQSELFIAPVTGGEPVKIADYHKTKTNENMQSLYSGYGGH